MLFAEEVAALARGGLLYDNWPKVLQRNPPKKPNPAYPDTGAYLGTGHDYRCKECHGWDYRGKLGAYRTGKHRTGITGIRRSRGKGVQTIKAILADVDHGFDRLMAESDLDHLALFVSKGQIDMDRYIDRTSRKSKGKPSRGAPVFATVCAKCHGLDGRGDANMEALGPLSRKNPWETLHKILNGQPDADMLALRAFGIAISLDVLAYAQTLPE